MHTVTWFQVFLSNKNNLHIVIWFQVFLSNTNNLHTVIWFQILFNTNNLCIVEFKLTVLLFKGGKQKDKK